MRTTSDLPTEPPVGIVFRRRVDVVGAAREVWAARELVLTLAERDFRSRYKQAFLGLGWTILTPLALMIIFVVFFQRVARVETNGAPYVLFSYLGLLSWTFFSGALSRGGLSLDTNKTLLNKVYCPREVFPIASVLVAVVDTLIAMLVLVVLFVITGFAPRATSFWVPVLLAIQLLFTLGVTILTSAIVVYFRDLRHALPILLQLGLFATPVAYGIDKIGASARPLYSFLNPLAPIIDGYRRTMLWGQQPAWDLVALGALSTLLLLVGGYVFFKKVEPGIADVA